MSPEGAADLDELLALWRQGDAILDGAPPFVFLADMARPLSAPARGLAGTGGVGIDVVDAPGPGLAVVSQTCDVVRSCTDRPYVELCPLVALPPDILAEVRGGYRPRFAALSGLADRGLAVDLDRTVTLEKAILAPFTARRVVGVRTDQEARTFANAAARKRNRAALPDGFCRALKPVQSRIRDKYKKESREGHFLRRLEEMRVRPHPSWEAAVVHVEVLFVHARLGDIPTDASLHMAAILARFAASDAYPKPIGRAVSLDSMTAADYLESDRLDLEHLSVEGE